MAKITLGKLNRRAVEQILKHPTTRAEMLRRAQIVARAAGPGYKASAITGRSRARASVITTTARAVRDNSRNQTLLKSIGRAR
ncbi:hypothetical protein CRM73_00145 [Kocuria sp. CCUG 69068]|uniref:hypothetical protein n=1 Tax=Kocuria sp. CCUG 69068 TaxID=2043138 RepID=UPI001E64D87F|nr:hypothetical protein [Kocuria sp. CCUG 69068]